jgi:hypothetical protein
MVHSHPPGSVKNQLPDDAGPVKILLAFAAAVEIEAIGPFVNVLLSP